MFKALRQWLFPKPIPCRCGSVDLEFREYNEEYKGRTLDAARITCLSCGNHRTYLSNYCACRRGVIKMWNWCNQKVEIKK